MLDGYGTIYELTAAITLCKPSPPFNPGATVNTIHQPISSWDSTGRPFRRWSPKDPCFWRGTVWELSVSSSPIDTQKVLKLPFPCQPFSAALPSIPWCDLFGTTTLNGGPGPQGSVFELIPVTVPEPSASVLMVVGTCLSMRRRRMRLSKATRFAVFAAMTAKLVPSASGDAVTYLNDPLHDDGVTMNGFVASPTSLWSANLGGLVFYPLIVQGQVYVTMARSCGRSFGALNSWTGHVVFEQAL